MYKKLTVISTTILLGLGSTITAPSVMAESNRSGIQAGISQANQAISQYQKQLDQLKEQVARVDQAITDNQKMIADNERKMSDSKAEISELQKEVADLNERIAKRNDILKERAKAYQESGGEVSYLDVLLGASSFSDFIDRINAVATMVQADSDLMKQHEADKDEVEKKQAAVQKKLEDLVNMKADLLDMQEQVLEQKAQNDELKAELEGKQQDKIAERARLQQEELSLAPKPKPSKQSNSNQISPSSISASLNISTPKPSGTINDIITAGYKYIGNSVYVFGGGRSSYDIANGRFDCSAFVHWAYAQGGYKIGASTDSLKNTGTRVSPSEMKPGDLVFFNTYKTDGHVGIYIGGGKFIGSQSSSGVSIANLSSGYWRSHFNGRVMRIVNE